MPGDNLSFTQLRAPWWKTGGLGGEPRNLLRGPEEAMTTLPEGFCFPPAKWVGGPVLTHTLEDQGCVTSGGGRFGWGTPAHRWLL